MQDQQPISDHQSKPEQKGQVFPWVHRLPLSMVAGLAVVALAAGSGTAWWRWNAQKAPTSPLQTATAAPATVPTPVAQQPATSQPAPTTPAQPTEQTLQIYWLKDVDNKIELVASPLTLRDASQPDEMLTAALEKLLAGPTDADVASTIPQGTALRSVTLESDGIHIDLSSAFKSGGGSTSMTGRLAQLLYTATSLEPDSKVWLSVDGEPLEVLGGEGLIIDQPMTRQMFESNFTL